MDGTCFRGRMRLLPQMAGLAVREVRLAWWVAEAASPLAGPGIEPVIAAASLTYLTVYWTASSARTGPCSRAGSRGSRCKTARLAE